MSTPSIADLLQLRGAAFLNAVNTRVANAHGVDPEAMLAKGRRIPVARARHVAWLLIYRTGRFSLSKIGNHYAGRDHTTVKSGIAQAEADLPRAAA